MKSSVANQVDPWYSAYQNFSQDEYSLSTYQMQGPASVIVRGKVTNNTILINDARAAYQNAIMWYITGDEAHANVSTTILNAWGTTLTEIGGLDASLSAVLEGMLLINAAEIMKYEYGWVEEGASYVGTPGSSGTLYRVFAPPNVPGRQANYGMVSIRALLAFSVYLDDVVMYNYALNQLQNDYCQGISALIQSGTGQSDESGRDQGNSMNGLSWLFDAMNVVYH
jgi:hypothetical protein